MKKIFIQVKEWILKHRRGLIYGVLASFVFGFCFFHLWGIWVENVVFAEDQQSQQTQTDVGQKKATEWYNALSFLNKIMYVLIYPMLLLAGKLVDNSLVYWEVLWFDAVLWQLWNIVKNLANFTLWFFFLYKIFKYLISWKESVKEIFLRALIAWIWIQASWFIIATLIDASTILTYWVWWLPISVLKEAGEDITDAESWKYNPAVLKNIIYVDVKDLDTIHTYLTSTTTWDILISECDTFDYGWKGSGEKLILAPKMIYYSNSGTDITTDAKRCHYYGQVYYFGAQPKELNDFLNWNKFRCDGSGCKESQSSYERALIQIKSNINKDDANIVDLITKWEVLQIRDAHTWWALWVLWTGVYDDNQMRGLDVDNKWTRSWWTTSRLQNIMDGNSYVWVFTALYSSLMNLWKWIIPPEAWWFASLLNTALSFWYVLAIWIPLIVVSIVFMIRICVLRLAVVLSPFIVLASAFKEIWEKVFKWDFLEYFKLEYLIPIIFSPAIICFAISVSTVLITIISGINAKEIATSGSEILWWLITLNIWWLSLPLMKLVISVFGVAITWFIVRAAIESSKIWESKIITSLKWLATSTLWSMPIVPIPWKDGKGVSYVWVNSAFGLDGQRWIVNQISDKMKANASQEHDIAMQQRLDPKKAQDDAKKAQDATQKAQEEKLGTDFLTAIQAQQINGDWTQMPIEVTIDGRKESRKFNDLSNVSKKAVIDGINTIKETAQRQKFKTSGEIQIWNDKYKFNNSTNKYEIEQAPQTSQSQQ